MRWRDLMLLLAGAAAAPRTLRAQPKAMPVIGFLGGTTPGPVASATAAFHQGLSEVGYKEQLEPLGHQLRSHDTGTGQISAWAAEAGD